MEVGESEVKGLTKSKPRKGYCNLCGEAISFLGSFSLEISLTHPIIVCGKCYQERMIK